MVKMVYSALQVHLKMRLVLHHGNVVVARVGSKRVLKPSRAIELLFIEVELFLLVLLVVDGDVLVVLGVLLDLLVELFNALIRLTPGFHLLLEPSSELLVKRKELLLPLDLLTVDELVRV